MVDASLRIVFLGTPSFAVPSLVSLLASRHTVVGIVTQPDRPRGRGQQVHEGPVKRVALEHGLAIFQPDRLRNSSALGHLSSLGADLGVVAAYGKILPAEVLALPRLGMVNVHASMLPRYRGAAPIQRAILAGERETGATIMQVVQELDAGPILGTVARSILPHETSVDVETDLARLGASLLLDVIDKIAAGHVSAIEQDARLATYAPRLTKADGWIDWRRPAQSVHNQVRGLQPWPHASTFLKTQRVILLETLLEHGPAPANTVAGAIVEGRGDRLVVAAGDGGLLRILRLQLEGRRPMSAREFLSGHTMPDGAAFRPAS